MRIYRSLEEAAGHFGPCALTIGNFDGVHAGHLAIVHRVVSEARARGWKAAALTFDPHPTKVVAPSRAPALLTTPETRCRLMAEAGLDQALILPFTRELCQWSPQQFVKRILVDSLHSRFVLVGDNFRFGHKAAGDVRLLAEMGRTYGFRVEHLPIVQIRGREVSSTEVRKLVQSGRIAWANRLLARPFALDGPVVRGHGIGSTQTVPTLNLAPETEVMPAAGVYVTMTVCLTTGRRWKSITNAGVRPTFGGESFTVETFLLDPLEGGSPERIRVEFLWRIREERKFADAAALKAQILKDVGRARVYHQRWNRWVGDE